MKGFVPSLQILVASFVLLGRQTTAQRSAVSQEKPPEWTLDRELQECSASIFTCPIEASRQFTTFLRIQFTQPLSEISDEDIERLVDEIPFSYQLVTGVVCDECRRRITLCERVEPDGVRRKLQAQSVPIANDFILADMLVDQEGQCVTAFDTEESVATLDDWSDFQSVCGFFANPVCESNLCCCSSCEVPGDVSITDMATLLALDEDYGIARIEEVQPDDPDECSDTITTGEDNFFIAFDYELSATRRQEFLEIFMSTYNSLTLGDCYHFQMSAMTPVEAANRRQLQSSSSGLGVRTRYRSSARTIPQERGLSRFYRNARSTRSLEDTKMQMSLLNESAALVDEAEGHSRFLQTQTAVLEDCLCTVQENVSRLPPELERFIEEFNNNLANAGFLPIGTLEELEEPAPAPVPSPKKYYRLYPKYRTSKASKAKGKGHTRNYGRKRQYSGPVVVVNNPSAPSSGGGVWNRIPQSQAQPFRKRTVATNAFVMRGMRN